jgi:hypothetical protein
MHDERRRSPRTAVTGVHVSIKEMGLFGRTVDKKAEVIDISATGLGIHLSHALKPGKDYLLGFELHWLHSVRHIQVRIMDCIPAEQGGYRVGVRIIKDEFSTISFIATAVAEQNRES